VKPTRKWWAARITAAGALAVMLLTGDTEVTDPEIVAIIGFVVEGLVSWLVPNQENTPKGDGVPA
jgi:hypothetical protein